MRFLVLFFLLFPLTVTAQENEPVDPIESVLEEFKEDEKKQETSFRYAPDFCDFEITFPEEPFTSRRCPPNAGNKCYKLQSYTMVYDLKTTVEVSVTCVPSDQRKFERYNERVMRTALRGMVTNSNIDTYDIGYTEEETYKNASLNGSGGSGAQQKIYTAQLWSGLNSVFTVEAKLTGRSHYEADTVFSDILQTVHLKKED
ncbi:MAG: hypothetical protein AAF988_04600 [Pseudomonadota bacterium]